MKLTSRLCRSLSALSSVAFLLFVSRLMAAPVAPPLPGSASSTSRDMRPLSPDMRAMTDRIAADVRGLTAFPSRVPGTPGNLQAASYVEKRFREIGLSNVVVDEYSLTAPVTQNGHATLNVAGRDLTVFPIYPNGVAPSTTPEDGLKGKLIYAGMGRPRDYNGLDVNGSIVALDFNSGMNWITAADLGARAIVFLEMPAAPGQSPTTRGEAERKFASLPVELPRFYAPRAAAGAIFSSLGPGMSTHAPSSNIIFSDPHVKGAATPSAATPLNADAMKNQKPVDAILTSRVSWERVKARNILGTIAGSDATLGKETIIIDGYYDSMAITPDLAPGAEAAGNCASLLELARYFKANPAPYTLMFVANGAHHISLAGARNFVAKHLVDSTGKATAAQKAQIKATRAFIGLDLTSRTETVGMFAKSSFYNQMTVSSENILLNQYFGFAKTMYENYAKPEAARRGRNVQVEEFFVDGIRGLEGRTWRSYLPSLVALDSEVATMAAKPGISFVTANDARNLQDTPFDVMQAMTMPNLARQVSTITTLLGQSLKSGGGAAAKNNFHLLPDDSKLSPIFGYGVSRAIYRNTEKITSFLPNDPVPNAVAVVLDRSRDYKTYSGVRGAFIEKALYTKDMGRGRPSVAQFVFAGPRVGDPKGGGTPDNEIEAYSVDSDGRIVFAPDMGSERDRFSPKFNKAQLPLAFKDEQTGQYNPDATTMCMNCRGVAFYDTLDQRYFTVLRTMSVLDGQTDAAPVEYGYLAPQAASGQAEIEPISVVFGKPGARFKLIMAQGLLGKRLVKVQTQPEAGSKLAGTIVSEGIGVPVPAADSPAGARVPYVSYSVARDLWTLDQQRIRLLKKFGIDNQRVDQLHGAVGCPDDGTDSEGNPKYNCPAVSEIAPTGGALLVAANALKDRQYDAFYREARRSFGIESRAYPDVEATSQDVLKGIIFYLALLLPFSYFLERLLFGFPDIRKQIIGTSILFLIVFLGIRMVHPAFELALTPFIILLAFIILALTVVVTAFLSSKFEAEIKRLKQGVHFADVGRLSALGAAVGLGIANMRRRPTRTALTCVTLILLTFTVLSFTSVTASISNFARPYGEHAPEYAGLMVRQPDWSPMQEAAVNSMQSEFRQRFGPIALRSWYLARDQGEELKLRVSNISDPSRYYDAPALLGMTPEEALIGSPVVQTVLPGGRWFQEGDRDVCLLPRSVLVPAVNNSGETDASGATTGGAASGTGTAGGAGSGATSASNVLPLGLTLQNAVGSSIQIAGQPMKVIGIFDDTKWSALPNSPGMRDLDDEQFTPVDYKNDQNKQTSQATDISGQKGEEPQVQRYQHMNANALLILPYQTALSMGATTRSIAAGFANMPGANAPGGTGSASGRAMSTHAAAGEAELQDLMRRAALGMFASTPDKNGKLETKLYSSVESASYEGFAALLVPIVIAALIIANTMLGSVFERTREIGIYSSVGLAPIHVAALFIAEATVYAVLGSISGYLVAQAVAKVVTATNLLPGITLNYSSSSAVLSTLIVMATVLLSTLYPAFQASRMSQPDIERKWQMSVPLGDTWRFQFPFTVSGLQPLGVAQFLADFFETHTDTSIGSFYTDRIHFSALKLREAREILGPDPVTVAAAIAANGAGANGANANGVAHTNGHAASDGSAVSLDGIPSGATSVRPDAMAVDAPVMSMSAPPDGDDSSSVATTSAQEHARQDALAASGALSGAIKRSSNQAADEETEVYRLSMRVWLAPFDMGVSQDVDIMLMPSSEPDLYELQLKLVRQSGEISAWKRVNRGFMSDLRKQLLLWRTIKPAGQQEYILRGRAHVAGRVIPAESPGAAVAAAVV